MQPINKGKFCLKNLKFLNLSKIVFFSMFKPVSISLMLYMGPRYKFEISANNWTQKVQNLPEIAKNL